MAVEIPRSVCVRGLVMGAGETGLLGASFGCRSMAPAAASERAMNSASVQGPAPRRRRRRADSSESNSRGQTRGRHHPQSKAEYLDITLCHLLSHTRHVRVGLGSSRAQSRLNATWPAHVFTRKRPRNPLDRSGPLRGACCQCSTCVRAWRACEAVGDQRVDARGHLSSVRAP